MILTEIGKTRKSQLEEGEFGVMHLIEGDTRKKIYHNQLKTFIWGSEEMLRRDMWGLFA